MTSIEEIYTQKECLEALKAGYDLGVKLNTVFACFCLNKYAEGGYELYKVVSDKAKAEQWYAAEPYKHWYEEMDVE